jgi:hypothetical protein
MMKKHTIAGFSAWCAATIFLGAFLLFQVQPVISKMILPWFGGSPAVWTTCLLFFQVLLLGGYAYADVLSRVEQPSRQAIVHLLLVGVALVRLPITPSSSWKPEDVSSPTIYILLLLSVSVGLPYFLLSATSPLLQAWFARVYRDRSPYRLYALSNVGSLGALLTYPFVVEPAMTTSMQGNVWSAAFIIFAAFCAVLTIKLWRTGPLREAPQRDGKSASEDGDVSPSWVTRLSWVLLPALGSALLLAITNHLCQNVAVVPLLWVVPLSLYLVTFIICFDREAWYVRRWFALGAVLAVLAASYLAMAPFLKQYFIERGYGWQWTYYSKHLLLQTPVYLAALFFLCMVCHGELVRRKPHARRLTSFYLSVAAGGAIGGVLVTLVCPQVFSTFFEMNLALVLGFALAMAALVVEARRYWLANTTVLLRSTIALTAVVASVIVVGTQLTARDFQPALERVRNFYGVLSVKEQYDENEQLERVKLYHGDTLHGYQLQADQQKNVPTSYYTDNSGVGRTFRQFREKSSLQVGAIGLGAGTIASYAERGQDFRFYEINPLVIELADKHFTFLKHARARGADVDIVLGDARLSLELEASHDFDILVVDAFSGDAIPVHLLTREAFAVYLRHVKRGEGVIAVHTSNRYLDLVPVVLKVAQYYNLKNLLIRTTKRSEAVAPSDWILLTQNEQFLRDVAFKQQYAADEESYEFVPVDDNVPLWTDQYNNLFQTIR